MIDRVELQKVLVHLSQPQERQKKQVESSLREEGVRVELSELVRAPDLNHQELTRKVEEIKEQIERGAYTVSPEKVLKGLEKFLSSK